MNFNIFDNFALDCLDKYFGELSPRKEKELQKLVVKILYLRQIMAGALAMLDADGVPESLDFRFLEFFRYCNGHVGIMNHEEYGLVCFPGSFSGELDAYGRGKEYVGALLSGEPMDGTRVANTKRELRGTIGVDCVVIPNNYLYLPDLPTFFKFSNALTEVDTSLGNNVFYSRLAPIITVANQKLKAAVDEVLKDINAGNLKSVVSDDLEKEIEGLKSIDIFNITDVKDVDKIQYLSKYHDDLLRRLYTLGGHAMSGTQKMAQQSAYEVGQNDTIAMIYPMERLDCLKRGLDKVNALFGTNITAKFSEAWQVEKEKIETSIASANMMQAGADVSEQTETEEKEEGAENEA